MLEPPHISEARLRERLEAEYGLQDLSLTFLPLGADLGSAVYRGTSRAGTDYFVKLRFEPFDEMTALLPAWLKEQGIAAIIPPLSARSGLPYVRDDDFTLLVHPFVEGHDAYEEVLTDEQWTAFGSAMRQVHDAPLPRWMTDRLPSERFDPQWRMALREWMGKLDVTLPCDAIARLLTGFMAARRSQVLKMVDQTDRLANALRASAGPFVLCHTDLHAWNLLLADDGRLFIVDWDAPLLAPRERDLMYPGGGQGFLGRSPSKEEALFYAGYGTVEVDLRTVAYYRLERIIEDLTIFCRQLLEPRAGLGGADEADRRQALRWAMANFRPDGVLEIANRTARMAEAAL